MSAEITQKYPVATTAVAMAFAVGAGVLWANGYGWIVIIFIVYQIIRVVFNVMHLVEQEAVKELKCKKTCDK